MKSRGVSANALKENRKNITFSQLLNIHAFAMLNSTEISTLALTLAKLNWARRVRNDVAHTGRVEEDKQISREKVNDAILAVEELRSALRKIPTAS